MANVRLNPEFETTDDKTRYLHTPEERRPYIVTFNKQHKLVDRDGCCLAKNKYLYVVDENDTIYCIAINSKWNHSFFLAGGPVKAAGMLEIGLDGHVEVISNESGHYTPTTEQMLPVLKSYLHYMDPIYEAHDQARRKIIRSYRMSDLINLYDDKGSDDLVVTEADLIAYSLDAPKPTKSQLIANEDVLNNDLEVTQKDVMFLPSPKKDQSKQINMDGYEEVLAVSPKRQQDCISRYGLAPIKPKSVPPQDALPSSPARKKACNAATLGLFASKQALVFNLGVAISVGEGMSPGVDI